MTKYIIKRILIAIPVLLGITVIDYAIMCMAGSPLEMLQGPRVSEAAVQAKAIALGLDKPFYVQYFVWLGQLLHGNMGYSIKNYQPVAAMITSHLGPTLLLMGVSLLVSILLAVPAGIYSAIHQYSKGDYTVVTLSFLGSSIPGFFPCHAPYLSVYGKIGLAAFRRNDDTWNIRGSGGRGGTHGYAGHCACSFHGRNQYPIYPQRGA